jgi:hypothetical protein
MGKGGDVIKMTGEYIMKCLKTGKLVGDFSHIIYGAGRCDNCGRRIMWNYVYHNKKRKGEFIDLGSECCKNVPKFTEAYAKHKLFRDKIKLYCRLKGIKLKDWKPTDRIRLADIECEIKAIRQKEAEKRLQKVSAQKAKLDDWYKRILKFKGKSDFLDSIRGQFESGCMLTERQIEVSINVMDKIEPAIAKQKANQKKHDEQVARVEQFVSARPPDWNGGSWWYSYRVGLGSVHSELLCSFWHQLRDGKLLSEKQEAVIAKCEHLYRKQLAELEVKSK